MAGRKVFTSGEILTAADVNSFLMDQSVMVFADSTARSSAIPSPSEGMVTFREDQDVVEVYDGSAFKTVGVAPAILQVVSTTKTDTFSASVGGGGSTAISGLTAAITPQSASSKVLIIAQIHGAISVNNIFHGYALTRSGAEIALADAAGSRNRMTAAVSVNNNASSDNTTTHINFLDSPGTASAITYGVNMFNQASVTRTILVNRANLDGNNPSDSFRQVSTITVMEVAV